MGYTHYWERDTTITPLLFNRIAVDFERLLKPLSDLGIKLGDGSGIGEPEVSKKAILFNGLEKCGHKKNSEISIPWPDSRAQGIGNNQNAISGDWFAGAKLSTRACNGDCSYETFCLEQTFEKAYPQQEPCKESGLWFAFCKTAFRPYDVAVTACLIIAKHHLGDKIIVSTDGENVHWQDAQRLCYTHLGYGVEYQIRDGKLAKNVPSIPVGFTQTDLFHAHAMGIQF